VVAVAVETVTVLILSQVFLVALVVAVVVEEARLAVLQLAVKEMLEVLQSQATQFLLVVAVVVVVLVLLEVLVLIQQQVE
jgi:hypothetical protein